MLHTFEKKHIYNTLDEFNRTIPPQFRSEQTCHYYMDFYLSTFNSGFNIPSRREFKADYWHQRTASLTLYAFLRPPSGVSQKKPPYVSG